MTEAEARADLERAIGNWMQARYPDDRDLVAGWLLLTELVPPEGGASFEVSSSEDMTLIRQVGLCEAARSMTLAALHHRDD